MHFPKAQQMALWRYRRAGLLLADVAAWNLSLQIAAIARYDGEIEQIDQRGMLVTAGLVLVLHLGFAAPIRLYQGRYRIGSLGEVGALAAVVLGAGIGTSVLLVGLPIPRLMPLSIPMVAAVMTLVGASAGRVLLRTLLAAMQQVEGGERVLIFGAGEAGAQLVRSMQIDPKSPYLPVGFLDDDPSKRHRRAYGLRVLGNRESIGQAARRTAASTLIIALPSADAPLLLEVSRIAVEQELQVKTLPALADLRSPEAGIRDVRDIDLAGILGRRPLDTDVDAIADYLNSKRVLVTGAGGSIGAELCRQIHRYAPAELIMLDRDESALHAVELALYGRALLDTPRVILADIRDAVAIENIFASRRPEVVFHAAALKHLPMLEQYPAEAWKSNVIGTANVLSAAEKAGVERFVNISTDKAANPISVLGQSKRIAERLTAQIAKRASGSYLSVRFGNVLGSRGSVLMTFAAQIAAGGPLTVTDPDVTRYLMTVDEAVQLVIQAAALGRGGEALVLDMGKPIRIDDVARRLVAMCPRRIDIVYTGLREGEKMHEDLLGCEEVDVRPVHPLISHVPVPPLDLTGVIEPPEIAAALFNFSHAGLQSTVVGASASGIGAEG